MSTHYLLTVSALLGVALMPGLFSLAALLFVLALEVNA